MTSSGARTLGDRSAVAATGAAIVEVDDSRPGGDRDEARGAEHPQARAEGDAQGEAAEARRAPQPGVPDRRRAVPRLQRDGGRGAGRRRREPDARAALLDRPLVPGPGAVGGQGVRQRRARRVRAGGAVHRQPACARAPHRRDGAVPAQRADERLRDGPARSRPRSTAASCGSSSRSTPTAPSTTSRRAATGCGARTASRRPGSSSIGTDLNRNFGFKWGCCAGSSGDAVVGDLPRPERLLRARDARGARLRQLARGRRRPADQGVDRHPHLLRAGAVAAGLHVQQHRRRGHDAGPVRRVRDARHVDGRRRTASRPSSRATCTSPTGRSSTGCGARTASSPTRSSCTRRRRTRASTRPTRRSRRRRPATATLPAADRGGRLPVPRDRQAGPVLRHDADSRRRRRRRLADRRPRARRPARPSPTARHARPADDLQRRLRGRPRLDRQRARAPTPRPPAASSAATRRRPPTTAPSSSAPPSAASTTSSRARSAGSSAGANDIDGGVTSIRSPAITLTG